MKTIGKNKRKKALHDGKRAILIPEMAKQFKVTERFVHLAIKRESQTELAASILKEYIKKYNELSKIICQY